MLGILVSSIVQVSIFSIVPIIWWFFTARKKVKLFQWIGLKKPILNVESKKLIRIIVFSSIGFIVLMYVVMNYFLADVTTATNQFSKKGLGVLPNILVYAVIQTSLSEEIVFRGFLGKRLMIRFGFLTGNTVQALLFGLLHGLPFGFETGNFLVAILLTLLPGLIGWLYGYINEKCSSGSIVIGWVIHALMNILSGLSSAI